MKYIFYFLLFGINCFSQEFEGKIIFKISYLPNKNAVIDTTELKKSLGSKMEFTVSNGKYKEITDSDFLTYKLYLPSENRLYFQERIAPGKLFYYRGDKTANTPFQHKIIKKAGTVLGYDCDKLVYKNDKYEMTFYYAPKLKVNPDHCRNFTFTNKNKISKLMSALFLKHTIVTKDFIATMEAVEVIPMKIEESEFAKPENLTVEEQ
ncbi:hypothetical protein NAT51_02745 [Flavobacterium amniphilum]|uniref:hypothetical protein n=1 Tax=Flavobacterium amniphilum TaxID=1834035 RepID=UPI002029F627|nr:hypothetical protein [Flavobacterium amniphilum]MCL9804423.1 hypothetical protein [Flavobacterium amniphilum]